MRSIVVALGSLFLVAACGSTTSDRGPGPSSLDETIAFLTSKIPESSEIRVEMGDKVVKHSTAVTRKESCVLAIRDERHSALGGVSEESDAKVTMDLQRVKPAIGVKEFTGSGYHGAVLTVFAIEGQSGIHQDLDVASSRLGLSHKDGPTETFEFTIADDAAAARIEKALTRAIDLCRP